MKTWEKFKKERDHARAECEVLSRDLQNAKLALLKSQERVQQLKKQLSEANGALRQERSKITSIRTLLG